MNIKRLYDFIRIAEEKTYAGGGLYEKGPERPHFYELVYIEDDWNYRDSYTGFYKSRGSEVVRYKDKPIWSSSYGGGMNKGDENMAEETFKFLKKAMLSKDIAKHSFRGPNEFSEGDWLYKYIQNGDIEEFYGDEQIFYKSKLVFLHKIIGGIIIDKE